MYIYEFWFTEEKKILEKFEDHCVKIMGKRREEGYSEDEILKDLCQATLQNLNSKDHIEDKEELGGSLGKRKRKRKTTAIMMESLDQANEQDVTKKKKRKDNVGKENVNCSQVKESGNKQTQNSQQQTTLAN